ncbi:MAG: AMP-binding protein [Actinomycetaceae bacterium]|nr:AMP-binding protein [Actinomycetaceae bacterium]
MDIQPNYHPLLVPGSTQHKDFTRAVRSIDARMRAIERRPLFLYSPSEDRIEQVKELEKELSHIAFPPDIAYAMRTSGSTSGSGKLVGHTTASLVASAHATHDFLGGSGTWISCLPSSHIAGFQTIFRSLLSGKKPIYAGNGKPEELIEATQFFPHNGRVYISLVPIQLKRLISNKKSLAILQHLDGVLVGGSAIDNTLLEQAQSLNIHIVTTYGSTETSGGCVYDGTPIGDTKISFTKDERVHIKGSCVAYGYIDKQIFDGSFTTSDIGYMDENKKLHIRGRADNAITTGGVTVIPEHVENIFMTCGYTRVYVIGMKSTQWGEEVIAIVDSHNENASTKAKNILEKGWFPKHIVSLAELAIKDFPMLDSGKIDRKQLHSLVAAHFSAP